MVGGPAWDESKRESLRLRCHLRAVRPCDGLVSNASLTRPSSGRENFRQLPPCSLPPGPVFPSFRSSTIITIVLPFTLPESTIRSHVQVYHSALTVLFQLPDISQLSSSRACSSSHYYSSLCSSRSSRPSCKPNSLLPLLPSHLPSISRLNGLLLCIHPILVPHVYLLQLSVILSCIIIVEYNNLSQ